MSMLYACPRTDIKQKQGESLVYRNPKSLNDDFSKTMEYQTLQDFYIKAGQKSGNPFLGFRRKSPYGNYEKSYYYLSYQTVFSKAERIGSALKSLGITKRNEFRDYSLQMVGFYCQNHQNYFISDIGCSMYGFTGVPIYDTHGEQGTRYIFEQTKLEILFIASRLVKNILEYKKKDKEFENLKYLVVLDEENYQKKDDEIDGVKIYTFSEFENIGQENHSQWAEITPQSIYTFCYTSGSTGNPKGTLISHENMVSDIIGLMKMCEYNQDEIYYSYLPMAHMLERICFNGMLFINGKIGINSQGIKKMNEDLQLLKPTVMVMVPRILTRIHQEIQSQLKKNRILQMIFESAVKFKQTTLPYLKTFSNPLLDKTIFRSIKNKLGGNVRSMVTGSAPIDGDVLTYLKIVFGCQIMECYGQTESGGGTFLTDRHDLYSGHLGGIIENMEFKLVDVPDLNYTHKDVDQNGNPQPRGELWLRGKCVVPGYYLLDDKNKETITEDGWLKTGDIAQLTHPNLTMQLIDRKKNIFKLSQGEYIAPDKLENIYQKSSKNFDDIFVYGDSKKNHLVAIVNVKKSNLESLKTEIGANNENLEQKLVEFLEKIRSENKLNRLEALKVIKINSEDWQELGLITNTMKKKRHDIQKYFKKDFDEIIKFFKKISIQNFSLKQPNVIISSSQNTQLIVNGKNFINFSSDNYFGFANHPEIIKIANQVIDERGFGTTSVRFICGTQDYHELLEQKISQFYQKEKCISYSSCSDANSGLIEALFKKTMIFYDEYCHSSIRCGIQLAKSENQTFKHNDLNDLENQLKLTPKIEKLIITQGVFEIDSQLGKLKQICELAQKYDCLVMVDDCLGLGVLGNHFKGTPEQQSCLDQIDIITGSFGKTLGSSNGGFVTAKSPIIDMLRQTSRPYLFSNAVSSSVAATVIKSLELLNENHERSQLLNNNIKKIRNSLQEIGMNIRGDEKLPIISIEYENQQQRDEIFEYLYQYGVLCLKNEKFKNILQIKMSVEHSIYDIENLIGLLKSFKKQ